MSMDFVTMIYSRWDMEVTNSSVLLQQQYSFSPLCPRAEGILQMNFRIMTSVLQTGKLRHGEGKEWTYLIL